MQNAIALCLCHWSYERQVEVASSQRRFFLASSSGTMASSICLSRTAVSEPATTGAGSVSAMLAATATVAAERVLKSGTARDIADFASQAAVGETTTELVTPIVVNRPQSENPRNGNGSSGPNAVRPVALTASRLASPRWRPEPCRGPSLPGNNQRAPREGRRRQSVEQHRHQHHRREAELAREQGAEHGAELGAARSARS